MTKEPIGLPLRKALEHELANALANARWRPAEEEARALEDAVRRAVERLGTRAIDVRCVSEGGDVVVQSAESRVRLWRQAVTGWWLSDGDYSPERTARRVADALTTARAHR